jgi:hypothetical protein
MLAIWLPLYYWAIGLHPWHEHSNVIHYWIKIWIIHATIHSWGMLFTLTHSHKDGITTDSMSTVVIVAAVEVVEINCSVLKPLPSSELEPRGRPFGWYFICTLRLMPEKCPYLSNRITFLTFHPSHIREVWYTNQRKHSTFYVYQFKTFLYL